MPGWNLIHPVPHNEVGMLGLNVILPVLNFALLCLVTYVLARVKKSAEVTAKKVADEQWWPLELARELQKNRGLQREGRRYKSYGTLWKNLRKLAIYDATMLDKKAAGQLLEDLSNWYFSEYGGLLLTPQARRFYFALQDLLRVVSKEPDGWAAERFEKEGEAATQFKNALEKCKEKFPTGVSTSDKETVTYQDTINLLGYFEAGKFEDWQKVAVEKGRVWKGTMEVIGASWKSLDAKQQFAVLQQAGSKLRSALTIDLESRER